MGRGHPGKRLQQVLVDYSALTDKTLLRLITHSHPDALAELYDRYSRLVFSLALKIVGDRATAEEITLDVFMRVWDKSATYNAERAKVTRHLAIDMLRRRQSRPELHSLSWVEATTFTSSDGQSPEKKTELMLEQEQLHGALTQLPPEQRQVLGLAYFGGYTHRQIAELLDQPLGTVKTRIRLALQKMRQMLLDG